MPIAGANTLIQADLGQFATTIELVDAAGFDEWRTDQPSRVRTLLAAQKFTGKADSVAIVPAERGDAWTVVAGVKHVETLGLWCLAKAAEELPEGIYRVSRAVPAEALLGWLLAHYRFDRYRKSDKPVAPRILLTASPALIEPAVREAEAVALVRDLVNTPAGDMGPPELEAVADRIARAHGATLTVTAGDVLESGYPMIHTVGMAAAAPNMPRLIEIEWGNPDNPRLCIVGKGVCFDSGGLDIKPGSGMRLMKKDMGGAAHALALGQMIMRARLPVRLHLLVPAVENAIAGNAFRPGDVLTSRKGLTVEITNTDAEGRLILADALTKGGEADPALIIDFATLTGAARTALGPDLPATFANDDELARALEAAAATAQDPLWRLPLHAGYDDMLKSDIADLNNAPESGFAGAITAALFLERFVPKGTPWAHLDTFAWRQSAKPGRPKGGEAIGLRAVWTLLLERFR